MQIKFLGTRGSIPVPGNNTLKYGGNTSCIEFISDENFRLIIDAGTGIRKINKYFTDETDNIVKLFITHAHWDHLQGFPFFRPIYNPEITFHIYCSSINIEDIKNAMNMQMSGKSFPISFNSLPSFIKFIPVYQKYEINNNLIIEVFENNHPGSSSAIKIINNNKSFTFITDNEIKILNEKGKYNDLVNFCKNSSIIAHDGQYLESEMKNKKGWGHSTIEEVLKLYLDSNIKLGYFTHHDPDRNDKDIDKIERKIHSLIKKKKYDIKFFAAKEDEIIII